MSGKVFSVSLIVFCLIFGIVLFYFQLFAYYVRVDNLSYIKVNDELIPVQNYQGIDSVSSALKLRGCFTVDPNLFEKEPIAAMPTPLAAPFWFRCFDHEFLHDQITKGNSNLSETTDDQSRNKTKTESETTGEVISFDKFKKKK